MWISPDGRIHKLVIVDGTWGKKPSEQTECKILIPSGAESFLEYKDAVLVIGDSDNYVRRTLDLCLTTMNESELAKFKIMPENVSFTIKLVNIKFCSQIHEWNAKTKFELAQKHKEKGVSLYKQDKAKDAAYRFVKALKIIHSIPINAETPPEEINNIPVSEINKLKANLYNNLASYYLKKEAWQLTIDTCKRVFDYDKDNVKAHYKVAIAFIKDKNFDRAEDELNIVLTIEPENRAAIAQMKHIKDYVHRSEVNYNLMVKKMFS